MKVVIAYRKIRTGSDPMIKDPYHAGGLASNALHSVAVLKKMGIDACLLQVSDFTDIVCYLNDHVHVTHMIIEAVWVTVPQLHHLSMTYPNVSFAVRAHSKMGFLQVEPEAITTMCRIIKLSQAHENVSFSSNNEEFSASLAEVFGACLYLPNLYDTSGAPPKEKRHAHRGLDTELHIASFGANRLLKLHPSAALAALQIGVRMNRPVRFYVNVDKTPGGESVRRSIRNLISEDGNAELVEVGWQDTETFKRTIAGMDLVLQLSATETFCMVAADAIASNVPVIGSHALNWLPKRYQVNADNTGEVARAGVDALSKGPSTACRETEALKKYLDDAKSVWRKYLGLSTRRPGFSWPF